jgi:YVTN family beta-propeller protein
LEGGVEMMTNKQVFPRCVTALVGIVLCALTLRAAPNKVRIIQTNSAGDNIHIIDPVTNKVVGEITGIEVSHGVAVSPDGSRIYVSDEAESTLDAVDVIDTGSLQDIKTIPTKGGIHNLYVTPDGKYVVAGSPHGKTVNVIDTQSDETAWTLDLGLEVRPMAFAKNPDGSTKWIFVQSDFNGFVVVDFAAHKEIKRIMNPDLPPGMAEVLEGADKSHGIAVTSDGKTLVVNSRLNNFLYTYSLPDLKLSGSAYLGETGAMGAAWVTLTPDGKTAYVAMAVTNNVAVVDLKSMKEVACIPVGFVPKRNITAMLQ